MIFVFTWIFQSCSMFSRPSLKPSWSLTRILKLVEAFGFNWRCWMSQNTQCLGSVLPLAISANISFITENWATQRILKDNTFQGIFRKNHKIFFIFYYTTKLFHNNFYFQAIAHSARTYTWTMPAVSMLSMIFFTKHLSR